MKIEQRGSKYRIRKMYDGKMYSLSLDYKPSLAEAELLLANMALNDTSKSLEKGTFEMYAKKYMSIQDNLLSPPTIRGYTYILRNLSDHFKGLQLRKITQAEVTEEINKYSVGRSPKTVRNAHGFIAAVMNMYRPEFALHTKLPQKVKPNKRVPTEEEVTTILNAVKDTRYFVPYRLACYGLRRSEVCALQLSDLSDDNHITINKAKVQDTNNKWIIKPYTKTTGSQRVIQIDEELADLIRKQGVVFDGHPSRLYDNLKVVQDRLGVYRFRLHDFRKYMATELSQEYSEADVMYMGGWTSDYTMKDIYRDNKIKKTLEIQKSMAKKLSFEGKI